MEGVKKHQYISENMKVIKRLIKSGDVSYKIIKDYNIYQTYNKQGRGGKMQRYQDTANYIGVSVLTVMNAIKSMEENI